MQLHCPVLRDNDHLPVECTCDGADRSVPIAWTHVPHGVRSFAVIVDDPDASERYFVHWLAWNIPGDWTRLDADITPDDEVIVQGTNGFGNQGWTGPCPPRGEGAHRYVVRVYALDTELELPTGANRGELEQAMRGHVLTYAELVTYYQRVQRREEPATPPGP